MKLGLEQPQALHRAIGSPADRLNIIHVAGTNGKGSVCHKLATVLQTAGYKVGLFSSPHISCFRERIRVNGVMISEKDVSEGLSKLFATGLPATFFEVTTVLALDYFSKQKVDWVVLETGLGGRLDATNIVVPKVSVITSIGFDHCQFLGNTIEQITREKAGIIKQNIPAVVGPTVPMEFIERDDLRSIKGDFENYEMENRAIAERVLKVLNIPFGEEIKSVPPCRFESITHEGQGYILDVAHNPQGLSRLFKRLQLSNPKVICGLSKGKDIKTSLEIILKHTDDLCLVSGHHDRVESIQTLHSLTHKDNIQCYESVTEAIRKLTSEASPIIICGTFFIMEEARRALGIDEESDTRDLQEKIC